MYYTIFLKGSNYNPEAGDYSPNVIQCIMYKELSQDPAIVENPAWWMSGKHILINILLFSFYFLPFLIRDRQRQTERSPFFFFRKLLIDSKFYSDEGNVVRTEWPAPPSSTSPSFFTLYLTFLFSLLCSFPDESGHIPSSWSYTHTHNVSIRSKIVQLITPPRTGK